jgi:hypothetical protein
MATHEHAKSLTAGRPCGAASELQLQIGSSRRGDLLDHLTAARLLLGATLVDQLRLRL